eukprot:10010475-Prorocentrum_lima.AAC.1
MSICKVDTNPHTSTWELKHICGGHALNKWKKVLLHSGWKTYATAALPLASGAKAKGHGGTW